MFPSETPDYSYLIAVAAATDSEHIGQTRVSRAILSEFAYTNDGFFNSLRRYTPGRLWRRLLVTVYPKPTFKTVGAALLETPYRAREERLPVHHTHPVPASERNAISRYVAKLVAITGRRRYDVGTVPRDDSAGSHDFFMPKDVRYPQKVDRVQPGDVVTMTDVDHYLSLDQFRDYAGHMMVIATYSPQSMAFATRSVAARPDGPNSVVMYVNGSSVPYRHSVYDWDRAEIIIRGHRNLYVYRVDRIHVGHHAIVALTPIGSVFDWFGVGRRTFNWACHYLSTVAYREVHNADKVLVGYARQFMNATGDMMFEFAPVNSFVSATIPLELHANLSCMCLGRKGLVNRADVTVALRLRYKKDEDRVVRLLDILTTYYTCLGMVDETVGTQGGVIYQDTMVDGVPPGTTIKPLAPHPDHADSTTPKAMKVGPMIGPAPAVIATGSIRSDIETVDKRLLSVASREQAPPYINKYLFEFRAQLLRCRVGGPLQRLDVLARQTRPLQKARNRISGHEDPFGQKFTVKAMQKNEPIAANKPARNISTVSTAHTLGLSAYMYAFKDTILTFEHFYAPGKGPRALEEALAAYVAEHGTDVIGTDFSKFDGTLGPVFCRLTFLILREYFGDDPMLLDLLDREYNAKCVTKNGLTYSNYFSRLSGSPMTTDMNTLHSAFVMYCCHRELGLNADESYRVIGLKGGDDSVDVCPIGSEAVVLRVIKDLGLRCDEIVRFQGPCVDFFSRHYCDLTRVGTGSFGHICRALNKLWLSTSNRPLREAAIDKYSGVLATESNTLCVGAYCRSVLRLYYRAKPLSVDQLNARLDKLDRNLAYKLSLGVAGHSAPRDVQAAHAAAECGNMHTAASFLELDAKISAARSRKELEALEGFFTKGISFDKYHSTPGSYCEVAPCVGV